MEEQPVVFWYLSRPTNTPLVLTLMPSDPKAKAPTFQINLDAGKSGIQLLDLSSCQFKLEPGVDYQLSMALKPVKNQGALDVFCSARIMRVDPPHALVAQMLATPDPQQKLRLLLKNGMFYDALTVVSRQINLDSNNQSWRERRASLLEQVGLPEVASFDRSPAPEPHSALEP
jgi:hypothetical protein